MWWSLFHNQVAHFKPATIVKRLQYRCFPVNLAKFLRTAVLWNTSGWLLLAIFNKQNISKLERERFNKTCFNNYCIYAITFWIYFQKTMDFRLLDMTSSYQRCSVKKKALQNFAKFTGKHLCWSFFFNKRERFWCRCFPVNFTKILKTALLQNTFRQLFLQYLLLEHGY